MNLKSRLSERIGIRDIREIVIRTEGDDKSRQELYTLLFDADDVVGYQAAWVFCHYSRTGHSWLYSRQEELIDEALVCRHPGKRRLLLNLILRQPQASPPRVDFMDFCMERMMSRQELPGVQTLCMKLAYELCRPYPELLHEFAALLEIMGQDLSVPSIRAVYRNILKDMKRRS